VTWPNRVRLGAVGYLNARPLVFGLERVPRFDLRFDVPSECARLLHGGAIDLGLIPSIEYLRGGPYRIVPDIAIASHGRVASVALYTTKPVERIASIAMDTSSRTSVALVRVLCAKLFRIQPAVESRGPDIDDMLAHCDAALIIGDNALLLEPAGARARGGARVEKIDLGDAWATLTGLPFVYAFWAGRPGALTAEDVLALQRARDAGVGEPDSIARAYFPGAPDRQAVGARYLRDNIQYTLGPEERAGLDAFYRYAVEAGVVEDAGQRRFYDVD
jgi:chorismate dehydratase